LPINHRGKWETKTRKDVKDGWRALLQTSWHYFGTGLFLQFDVFEDTITSIGIKTGRLGGMVGAPLSSERIRALSAASHWAMILW
jgi:hypothetical protein